MRKKIVIAMWVVLLSVIGGVAGLLFMVNEGLIGYMPDMQALSNPVDKFASQIVTSDGKPMVYIINPYQMAAKDGKYYLICNNDAYDAISNYRIDRIKDIQILDTKRKPFSKLKNSNGESFNLADYMKTHIYMYTSGDTRVRFKVVPAMVTDVLDIFGKDVRFEEETEDHVTVSASVTEAAMIQFAKSYSPDVVILEPQRMVDKLNNWAKQVNKVYGG